MAGDLDTGERATAASALLMLGQGMEHTRYGKAVPSGVDGSLSIDYLAVRSRELVLLDKLREWRWSLARYALLLESTAWHMLLGEAAMRNYDTL